MVGRGHDLEVTLGVDAALGKHEEAGHQVAGSGVGIAVAKGKLFAVLEEIFERLHRAVPVRDEIGIVAGAAVGKDDLGKDLAIGPIDRLDGGLVSHPGKLHLVETHRFDDTGIVGGEKGGDFEPGFLVEIVEERLPGLLEGSGGIGGDDAEIQFRLRPCGTHRAGKGDAAQREEANGQSSLLHVDSFLLE